MKIPFLKKLSERERKIVYTTILIGCLCLFYQYLLEPGCTQIKELNDQIKNTQDSKELDDRIRALKNIIQKEHEHYHDYMTPLKKVAEENRVLKELISDFAHKSKVTVTNLQTPQSDKEIKALLECEGEIASVIEFIYNLIHVKQPLKIEKIDLSLKTPKEDIVKCRITMSRIKVP